MVVWVLGNSQLNFCVRVILPQGDRYITFSVQLAIDNILPHSPPPHTHTRGRKQCESTTTNTTVGVHVSNNLSQGTSDRRKIAWVQNFPPVKLEWTE